MPSYENFFTFDYWHYEVVRHLFGFTVAVFAASLFYFALTIQQATAKYRTTFIISGVVMVSATIELLFPWLAWNRAFTYDAATLTLCAAEGHVFSNGYRYANWLIDVPMLLTQFLVVLQFTGRDFVSRWWKLVVAGAAMIVLGYIGQYYESYAAGFLEGSAAPFWIWGLAGWLPFFYLLWLCNDSVQTGRERLAPEAGRFMQRAWILLVVTWTVYGFVYLIPAIPGINQDPTWAVVRAAGYTFADVVSKSVFGILLAQVALIQSRSDGGAPGERARKAA